MSVENLTQYSSTQNSKYTFRPVEVADPTLLRIHPVASRYGRYSEEKGNRLREDLKKNGLLNPIVLKDGKVVDGQNRFLIGSELGIKLNFVEVDTTESIEDLVKSLNDHRRHEDASQRACRAVNWLESFRKQLIQSRDPKDTQKLADGKTIGALAKEYQVSKRYAELAFELKRKDPAAFTKVLNGEETLTSVTTAIKKKEKIEKAQSEWKTVEEQIEFIAMEPNTVFETMISRFECVITNPTFEQFRNCKPDHLIELLTRPLKPMGYAYILLNWRQFSEFQVHLKSCDSQVFSEPVIFYWEQGTKPSTAFFSEDRSKEFFKRHEENCIFGFRLWKDRDIYAMKLKKPNVTGYVTRLPKSDHPVLSVITKILLEKSAHDAGSVLDPFSDDSHLILRQAVSMGWRAYGLAPSVQD